MNNIRVTRRRNAKHVTGRRHADGTISITLPAQMSESAARQAIESIVAQLSRRQEPEWTPRFLPGKEIACGDKKIVIDREQKERAGLIARRSGNCWILGIGSELRPGERETDLAVNRLLIRIARREAGEYLSARAERIASRLGVKPSGWKIGYGHRTLGTCHSDRHISLSEILLFLPDELIDYVICHELAHLSEMNHSARFHALCDRYCGGRERELERKLKAYDWPIIR